MTPAPTATPPSPPYRLYNAEEVAERLGVSKRWVRDHATRRAPKLPVVKLGTLLRFRSADIDRFINSQREDHCGPNRRK
jgi:excisionase family DNA binding protein